MIEDSEGFWLSYIDVITVLVCIFLLLYIFTATRNSEMQQQLDRYAMASKEIKQFSDAWQAAEDKLRDMKANPYVDIKSGGWRLEIAEEILFDSESAELSKDGIDKIRKIGKILRDFIQTSDLVKKTIRIVVGGHCDPSGYKSLNLNLSDDRANNVAKQLKAILQDTNVFIETIGYGSRYLKPNAGSYREHRRITITIQPIAVDYLK